MAHSFYLYENGKLNKKNDTLLFECENEKIYLPITNIKDLYVFGCVSITKPLFELFNENKITVYFYNKIGHMIGKFIPYNSNQSGEMIVSQVNHYMDSQKRLYLAKQFVEGECYHILKVLRYYENRKKKMVYSDAITSILDLMYQINHCLTIPHLMSIEGRVREIYYSQFSTIVNNKYILTKRVYHPPINEFNALISYGNAIIYNKILTEILRSKLDERIGYLHSTNKRRQTLNLDISEIFKPIIIDRVIFSLINKNMIKKDDFKKINEGIYIGKENKKILVREIENKLESEITVNKRRVKYKNLIIKEIYKLQRHFMEREEYKSLKVRW